MQPELPLPAVTVTSDCVVHYFDVGRKEGSLFEFGLRLGKNESDEAGGT